MWRSRLRRYAHRATVRSALSFSSYRFTHSTIQHRYPKVGTAHLDLVLCSATLSVRRGSRLLCSERPPVLSTPRAHTHTCLPPIAFHAALTRTPLSLLSLPYLPARRAQGTAAARRWWSWRSWRWSPRASAPAARTSSSAAPPACASAARPARHHPPFIIHASSGHFYQIHDLHMHLYTKRPRYSNPSSKHSATNSCVTPTSTANLHSNPYGNSTTSTTSTTSVDDTSIPGGPDSTAMGRQSGSTSRWSSKPSPRWLWRC